MGKSDGLIKPFYNKHIKPSGETALLGFTNNSWYKGDLYDKALGNWEINSEWKLDKQYDTIICTRCAYFAKDALEFIERCCSNLKDGGRFYIDWGLGDHFRFKKFKVGFKKNGEHEYCYGDTNFEWSTIWSQDLEQDPQVKLFKKRIAKYGYHGALSVHIDLEVPNVLDLATLKMDHSVYTLALWEDMPQLYILLEGIKNG